MSLLVMVCWSAGWWARGTVYWWWPAWTAGTGPPTGTTATGWTYWIPAVPTSLEHCNQQIEITTITLLTYVGQAYGAQLVLYEVARLGLRLYFAGLSDHFILIIRYKSIKSFIYNSEV